jgi:hypothetical protein
MQSLALTSRGHKKPDHNALANGNILRFLAVVANFLTTQPAKLVKGRSHKWLAGG